MKRFLPLLSLIALITACKTPQLADRYQRAVQDAMYPTDAKVDSALIAVNSDNASLIRKTINGAEHILMVSWKARNFYPDSGKYNTGNYEIWVTTAPELLRRMADYKGKDRIMRVRQLLGLPPTADYQYFIEFWVKPNDLFRPCPDKEVTDSRCHTCFTKADSADAAHIRWINDFRISAYYNCGLYNQYPWTELGYTYDWAPGNKRHQGLSEFVIGKGKDVYVERIYRNDTYLSKKP